MSEVEPDPDPEELYSTTRVAQIFGVAVETVRDWIKSEKIKGVQVNGYWKVPRSEVIRVANDRSG